MALSPTFQRSAPSGLPKIQLLRDGWARHVQFGLSHPELYLQMYAGPHLHATGRPGRHRHQAFRAHMRTVAAAGDLRVSEDHAAEIFHAAAGGIALTLLAEAKDTRDMALSEMACDAVLAPILAERTATVSPDTALTAIALRVQIRIHRTKIVQRRRKEPCSSNDFDDLYSYFARYRKNQFVAFGGPDRFRERRFSILTHPTLGTCCSLDRRALPSGLLVNHY